MLYAAARYWPSSGTDPVRGPRPLPDEPTDEMPGEIGKLLVLQARALAGQQLHHPQDRRVDRHLGDGWEDEPIDLDVLPLEAGEVSVGLDAATGVRGRVKAVAASGECHPANSLSFVTVFSLRNTTRADGNGAPEWAPPKRSRPCKNSTSPQAHQRCHQAVSVRAGTSSTTTSAVVWAASHAFRTHAPISRP